MFKKVLSLFMVLAVIAAIGCVCASAAQNQQNNPETTQIDILKDAASSSIYGSRAANGVILVTDDASSKGHDFVLMNTAPDGAAAPDDTLVEVTVKQMIYDENSDTITGPDDVILESCVELSNGMYLIQYQLKDVTYSEVAQLESIGGYVVTHGPETPFYIFTSDAGDGELIELKDAYEQGIINDDIMDELVESSEWFSKAEEKQESPATPDEVSTPDQVDKNAKSGPAIQTGAVFSGIVFLLMAGCIAAAVFYRRKLSVSK